MKKMLVKAVALSLVMGGVGFVANDALAAKIGDGVEVYSGTKVGQGRDVKTYNKLPDGTVLANQKDLVNVNKDVETNKANINTNKNNIAANQKAIDKEVKDRDHADQKLQDQITINKGQIENEATNRANEDKRIEAKFDGEVSRLDGRIDKLNDNVQKVGAMAAAIANLHTMGYDPEAPTEIAVGVGQYRDKTGLALGAFHYPNRDFMLSFNVSTAGDEFMGGIGATWKFGRKSPEELRQAEAEKAAKAKLAKAEAAKKAAKDARVAAQQKRHAEMLAARTGK